MKIQTYFLLLPIILLGLGNCTSGNKTEVQELHSPASANGQLPSLTTDSAGNVFLSWVHTDTAANRASLLYAKLNGDTWTLQDTIATSTEWFINWADFPSIVAEQGRVTAAHVLKKVPGGPYSYYVNIYNQQQDGSWSSPIAPHLDSTATEHGFVSMVTWHDNTMAIWLDGRRTADRSDQEYFDLDQAMTLRSAIVGNNGVVTNGKQIDDSVCDCCNTALAMTSQGPIAAYRNRTDEEIRDIYISRYINEKWTTPKAVHHDNWEIAACPVNGPAVAAQDSAVAVAWYTAANDTPRVLAAISSNNGKSFSEPIVLNEALPTGRVAATADDSYFYVSWMEGENQESALKVKRIQRDGMASSTRMVAPVDVSRNSGFPQMVRSDSRLIFAWSTPDSLPTIKTASLDISTFER